MSDSHTAIHRSPTWPPDYSSYAEEEVNGEEGIVQILQNEANSSKAPDSYKTFISKLSEKLFELQIQVSNSKDQCERYESKIKNTSIQCDTYADYLSTARENYDLLFEILQEERIQRMELEKKTLDLESEVEKLKNNTQQESSINRVATAAEQPSIPPPPSTTVTTATVTPINMSPSSQQHSPSPSPSQPIRSPQQPSSVTTAAVNHDACRAQIKQYKEKITDLERKMDRSANGRKNLEDQLVQYYKTMSTWEKRAMDFDAENKRLQQVIHSKDIQLRDAQTQLHNVQAQLHNTQQHLRITQQQHEQLTATSQQLVNNPQILKHLQYRQILQMHQLQQQQQPPLFVPPTNNTPSDNNNNNNSSNRNNNSNSNNNNNDIAMRPPH